jgi:hypothetical protein
MHRFFHWIIFSAALIMLLLAVGIEHPIFNAVEYESAIFNKHAGSALLKELAFALLIALVISLGIDRRAREEDARIAAQTRQVIAEDVFKGVFASELPPDYIQAVVKTTLKCPVIREYLDADFTISELSDEERVLGKVGADYVRFKQITRYRLKNVSLLPTVHPIRYAHPIRSGALASLAGVQRFRIGANDLSTADIANVREASNHVASYVKEIRIEPGETIDVLIEAATIKHRSDNEIWATFLPTLSYDLAMTIEPRNIVGGVRAITATQLTEVYRDREGGGGRWSIEGPILPNESIVIFWNEN